MAEGNKDEAIKSYRESLIRSGNLSVGEVNRLVEMEFTTGIHTIEQQIDRYALKLKVDDPKKSNELITRTKGMTDAADLSMRIGEFVSGAVISSSTGEFFSSGKPIQK